METNTDFENLFAYDNSYVKNSLIYDDTKNNEESNSK